MSILHDLIWSKMAGSGGSGGSVTPASVLSAMEGMDNSQQSDARAAIGATDALTSIPDDVKQAMLNCFAHVAWTDANGQDYYNELSAALYLGPLESISAVFTQGANIIYNTDPLDDLRQYLVVTAHYTVAGDVVVTGYDLSGTLTVGTSTITVLYGGKTTTFTVTVTDNPVYGYNEVGSPSIIDNVLYPANSNGGYIKNKRTFSPSGAWKMQFKIKINENTSTHNIFMTTDENGDRVRSIQCQALYNSQNGIQILFYISSNGSTWDIASSRGPTNVPASTEYFIELEFTGSAYIISYSTDNGATWTQQNNIESSTAINGGVYFAIGCEQGTALPVDADIDLTALKVWDGSDIWWQAVR